MPFLVRRRRSTGCDASAWIVCILAKAVTNPGAFAFVICRERREREREERGGGIGNWNRASFSTRVRNPAYYNGGGREED